MDEAVLPVRRFTGDEALPQEFDSLIARLARDGDASIREWLDCYRRHRVGPGSEFRLYAVAFPDGSPAALLPAIYSRLYLAHPRARVVHFLQPDGLPYLPLTAQPSGLDQARIARSLIAHLCAERPRHDVLRISPLAPDSEFSKALAQALRKAAHPVRVERLAGDRRQTVAGATCDGFMALRPQRLKLRLEEGRRSLVDAGRVSFRMLADPRPGEIEAAWRDYCVILDSARYVLEGDAPDYVRGLMDVAVRSGTLRLGFADFDKVPAAVQFWRLSGNVARCLRIWSGPEYRDMAIDDLLTRFMLRRLIDFDRVEILDFGAITEEFALDWAPAADPRTGLIGFNPRTSRGLRGAVRHLGAAAIRSLWVRRRGRA